MAFCPECGKSAATGATRCIHCGFEFAPPEKKPGGNRFKGTMMMAAPVIAKPAEPANANSANAHQTPTVPRITPPRGASAPPIAAPAQAAPAAPALEAARKPNIKGTMIGPGIAPAIAKPAPAAPIAAAAPAHAARAAAPAIDNARQAALAETQALMPGITQPHARPAPQPVAAPQPAAAAPQPQAQPVSVAHEAEEPKRYLPGDPMAPHPVSAPRIHVPRLSDEGPAYVPKQDRKWLMIAVGGAVLLSVLLLVFGLMH